MSKQINVLLCSYLEPEYVKEIRKVDQRLNVVNRTDLIPAPRYAGDHTGKPFSRTSEQEEEWRALLAEAEVLFDFDKTNKASMPELAPNVKWIQATSTGIGQFVHDQSYDTRMPGTVFTVAGVHGQPLAEFSLMAILMHYKKAKLMLQQQQEKKFDRFSGSDLAGRTIGIIGLGRNGQKTAQLAKGLNMRTIGTSLRAVPGAVDTFYPVEDLKKMVEQCDVLVVALPETPVTKGMVSKEVFDSLPADALFINISRGSVVDEDALTAALQSGHLGGAALDVFCKEPLPLDSPLWEMENVLISPHAASVSDQENKRLCDVFCENLRRYLAGHQLLNMLDTNKLY